MRFSLSDEDAREKAAGQSWPTRIERLKEAALAVYVALYPEFHMQLTAIKIARPLSLQHALR